MGLIARALETQGIPTVTLAASRAQIAGTRPPRTLLTPFVRGRTVGPPDDAATQRAVLRQALALLLTAAPGAIEEFRPESESESE